MAVTSTSDSQTVVSSQGMEQTKSVGTSVAVSATSESEQTKTCHQCRQKTKDFVQSCKTMKKDKHCVIKYCRKCLFNRYGEKVEEVELLDSWICPKCRGNCNCSVCMKKKGYKPTGILVQKARKTGYGSVSEMLRVKGLDDLHAITKNETNSPQIKDSAAASPLEEEKENSVHGDGDSELGAPNLTPSSKKIKREGTKEVFDSSKEDRNNEGASASVENCEEIPNKENSESCEDLENTNFDKGVSSGVAQREKHLVKVQLPQGTSLVTVAGIDLLPTDIGHALQFLEFCSTFGEVFDIKKGQAESVIREMVRGRNRQLPYSIGQIHIQLLTLIKKDMGKRIPSLSSGEKDSWVKALGECISESQSPPLQLPTEIFASGVDEYNTMDSSKKLQLLNFLCDEALNTMTLRSWIENKISKFGDQKREDKEKFLQAKNKEQILKKQMEEKLAEAVAAKNGDLLTISEHDAVTEKIKGELAEAHREMVETKSLLPKKRQRADALRTQPILSTDGRTFWRLRCYSNEPDILLQEASTLDEAVADDKWFVYEADQKKDVEKYISSHRTKRRRTRKVVEGNQSLIPETISQSQPEAVSPSPPETVAPSPPETIAPSPPSPPSPSPPSPQSPPSPPSPSPQSPPSPPSPPSPSPPSPPSPFMDG